MSSNHYFSGAFAVKFRGCNPPHHYQDMSCQEQKSDHFPIAVAVCSSHKILKPDFSLASCKGTLGFAAIGKDMEDLGFFPGMPFFFGTKNTVPLMVQKSQTTTWDGAKTLDK